MSQEDYIIEDQLFPAFRTDLNNNLAAIVSNNSGASEPSTTYAYMWWADTNTGILKQRDAANSAWIDQWPLANGSGITLGTPQATTSGTQKDFSGITAGTKQIMVLFNGTSVTGGGIGVQLGDAGGFEVTGYIGISDSIAPPGDVTGLNSTVEFPIDIDDATVALAGQIILNLFDISTNTWVASHTMKADTTPLFKMVVGGGSKSLSSQLTQVRIKSNGSDTFDAGQVNIQYQ